MSNLRFLPVFVLAAIFCAAAPGPGLPAYPMLASWDGGPHGFRRLGWSAGQAPLSTPQPKPAQKDAPSHPAEDISAMYNFLNEGEFLQINVEGSEVTGYVSRMGTLESDRGDFFDQFFDSASIQGQDVTFVTKTVHGVWYEFKGRFDHGLGKNKGDDGYYVLRGTLTEYTLGADKTPTSHARQVEFKSMGQPEEVDLKKKKKK